MDHTLINPNQLRHFDTEVQDNPYHATDTMSITSPNGEFMACLQSQGTHVFLNTWRPTKTQLSSLPHIVLTSPRKWDPHKIEFPATKYYVQEEIESRNVSQTNVRFSNLEEQTTVFEEDTNRQGEWGHLVVGRNHEGDEECAASLRGFRETQGRHTN